MHASIEQLLDLRDKPAAGISGDQIAGHVKDCTECADVLHWLRTSREQMRALPEQSPAVDLWPKIRARAEAECSEQSDEQSSERAKRTSMRYGWPVGLAASLLVATLLIMQWPEQAPDEPVQNARVAQPISQPPTSKATRDLVSESRRLEELLRTVTYQPRVVNAGTAGTIAQLEDQIAFVDYGLSAGTGSRLSGEDANALWEQRVELMNTLVYVRYAQAQRIDF